jgi:hypothetical protein
MHDPRTFWLTVTNIILGLAVVLAIAGVLTGTLCDMVANWKKHRGLDSELDRDMRHLFGDTRSRK